MPSPYCLNGLKLESDFDLPGMPCWDGRCNRLQASVRTAS
jgi:hypothetical protein